MKKKLYFVVFKSPIHKTLYGYSFDYDSICFGSKFLLDAWKRHVSESVLSSIVYEFVKCISYEEC